MIKMNKELENKIKLCEKNIENEKMKILKSQNAISTSKANIKKAESQLKILNKLKSKWENFEKEIKKTLEESDLEETQN